MSATFVASMQRAAVLTREGKLSEATQVIREALNPEPGAELAPGPVLLPAAAKPAGRQTPRSRKPLGVVLRTLSEAKKAPRPRGPTLRKTPDDDRFTSESFRCAAGERSYRLYVPSHQTVTGLIVMLHGCTQTSDDFAAGTRMNALAEAGGFAVAYPEQIRSANMQGCWNWFRPSDQVRGSGEPAILAGMAKQLQRRFGLGPETTAVAGLSAGGAMAAVMGATYPDVFGAVGVHSGLPYKAADDVMSALSAMRGQIDMPAAKVSPVRTIVLHGTDDATVHPANADAVWQHAVSGVPNLILAPAEIGKRGGRRFERQVALTEDGKAQAEHWRIEAAGHAWSGGSADGSYADAEGPDASAEMARFFFEGQA